MNRFTTEIKPVYFLSVTTWIANMAGRYLGFPKYISDITLSRRGDGWIGTGLNRGLEEVSLEFYPGLPRTLEGWERELVENESF